MLYVADAELTGVDPELARRFLEGAEGVLHYAGFALIKVPAALSGLTPAASDGVAFFNPTKGEWASPELESFVGRSLAAGAVLLPIALDEVSRIPPAPASVVQSFDAVDHLRRRELHTGDIEIAGQAFGREAIARLQPTCSQGRLRVFICHRRSDGEQLASWVDGQLAVRHEGVFRDLVDIQVGEVAQDVIEEALDTADAVLFLDTPAAGESVWIQHELSAALRRRIPVVWLRVGNEEGRVPLVCRPADEPHLSIPNLGAETASDVVDQVLHAAFVMSREVVSRSLEAFRSVQVAAAQHDVLLNVLDQRRLIFEARHPPGNARYPKRSRTDILQVFGRKPTQADRDDLLTWLNAEGWGVHERECRPFDAVVQLVPRPIRHTQLVDTLVEDTADGYLREFAPASPDETRSHRPVLAILGAFSDSVDAQFELLEAVAEVTRAWVQAGGSVVMGGHPSFTPVVIGAAADARGDRPTLEVLHIYQSAFFVSPESLAWLEGRATLTLVPAVDGDRDASLSMMRSAMLQEQPPAAAVALGGRMSEGGSHAPGVAEEVELLAEVGVPVVLGRRFGGFAAELARRADTEDGWVRLAGRLDAVQISQISNIHSASDLAVRLWESLDLNEG